MRRCSSALLSGNQRYHKGAVAASAKMLAGSLKLIQESVVQPQKRNLEEPETVKVQLQQLCA